MLLRVALMICMLGLATGCLETRTYSLVLHNTLPTDVSICPTKRNGPMERGWESPEQLIEPPHPASEQRPPGVIVPAGKTASSLGFTGQFDPGRGRAILRIYAGKPNLTEMNAISIGSTNRLDIPLDQGMNRIEVKLAVDGTMTAIHLPSTQPSMR